MSTEYYYLRKPITGVALEEARGPGGFDQLRVWDDYGLAGTLVLKRGRGREVALLFANRDSSPPMRTHGGAALGCVVTENVQGLDPALVLISENGEPVTVADVRALAGGA